MHMVASTYRPPVRLSSYSDFTARVSALMAERNFSACSAWRQ